jgi:tetratricopeptide (TPR) repeat protein
MPRLSPLQWVLVVVFLAFYGFAVFALTRDYYLRHPPVRPEPVQSQAERPAPRTWIQDQLGGAANSDIPAAITGTDPVLLNRQADTLFAQNRWNDAIPLYRRVLELDPNDVDAMNDLGLALHYTGRSQEGLELLEKGAGMAPDFQRMWLTLGFVRANSDDAAGAREALTRARDIDPNSDIGREAERMLGLIEE